VVDATADVDDAERIGEAFRWLQDVTSTRRVASRFGTALYHDEFRDRYDSNVLRVEGSGDPPDASELIAECDRLYAGFAHREIFMEDERRGAALAPTFAERGWRVERFVTMALRDAADRDVAVDATVEVDTDEAVRFGETVHRAELRGVPEDVADMLAAFRRVLRERAGARFFGVRADGDLVSACEMYLHDGAAEIESVDTLERFRGRGYARAVVTRAATEAIATGADLVWLIADDEDWPKELYRRMGFRPVTRPWQFTLPEA
jgi:ribosomal protein S18 acetylase RimI-like enzyme